MSEQTEKPQEEIDPARIAAAQRLEHVHLTFKLVQNVYAFAGLDNNEILQASMHHMVTATLDGHENQIEAVDYLETYMKETLGRLRTDVLAKQILPDGTTK